MRVQHAARILAGRQLEIQDADVLRHHLPQATANPLAGGLHQPQAAAIEPGRGHHGVAVGVAVADGRAPVHAGNVHVVLEEPDHDEPSAGRLRMAGLQFLRDHGGLQLLAPIIHGCVRDGQRGRDLDVESVAPPVVSGKLLRHRRWKFMDRHEQEPGVAGRSHLHGRVGAVEGQARASGEVARHEHEEECRQCRPRQPQTGDRRDPPHHLHVRSASFLTGGRSGAPPCGTAASKRRRSTLTRPSSAPSPTVSVCSRGGTRRATA